MPMSVSKALEHSDSCGFEFAKEMLDGDVTAGINFDRLQKHPQYGYIIFEYLRCKETQPNVNPYTSHPNRYWYRNKEKFIALKEVADTMNATLYLVNYARRGTKHEDKVLLIKVLQIDPNKGIVDEEKIQFTRATFKEWFRNLNRECLCPQK